MNPFETEYPSLHLLALHVPPAHDVHVPFVTVGHGVDTHSVLFDLHFPE